MNVVNSIKQYRSLIQSIILHVLILLLFFVGVQHSTTYKIPGKANIISSYIQIEDQPIKTHSLLQPKLLKAKHAIIKAQHKHTPQQPRHHQRTQHAQLKAMNGTQENALVTLLYRTINAHKQYPEIAQQMGRTGIVQLSFKLFPDGHISQLHVIHSSGSKLLDHSALTAVRDTMPLAAVKHYLNNPQDIVINIAFKTGE